MHYESTDVGFQQWLHDCMMVYLEVTLSRFSNLIIHWFPSTQTFDYCCPNVAEQFKYKKHTESSKKKKKKTTQEHVWAAPCAVKFQGGGTHTFISCLLSPLLPRKEKTHMSWEGSRHAQHISRKIQSIRHVPNSPRGCAVVGVCTLFAFCWRVGNAYLVPGTVLHAFYTFAGWTTATDLWTGFLIPC